MLGRAQIMDEACAPGSQAFVRDQPWIFAPDCLSIDKGAGCRVSGANRVHQVLVLSDEPVSRNKLLHDIVVQGDPCGDCVCASPKKIPSQAILIY